MAAVSRRPVAVGSVLKAEWVSPQGDSAGRGYTVGTGRADEPGTQRKGAAWTKYGPDDRVSQGQCLDAKKPNRRARKRKLESALGRPATEAQAVNNAQHLSPEGRGCHAVRGLTGPGAT